MQGWGGVCSWGRPQVTPGLPAAEPWAGDGQWFPLGLLLPVGQQVPSSQVLHTRGDIGSRGSSLRAEGTREVKQAAWGLASLVGGEA